MPTMKLNSTYEDLKGYVQAQMQIIDDAIKRRGTQRTIGVCEIKLAMEEIAACNKLVQDKFAVDLSDYRGQGTV